MKFVLCTSEVKFAHFAEGKLSYACSKRGNPKCPLFSVSEVFAAAKVKLLHSEVCATHK